jgi:putative membrane protein
MDPKVLFWTGALVNMALIVTLALFGVRARRRGDIAQHRRLMLSGAGLVGFFLVSYVFKLVFLGREDMSLWSPYAVWVLRFHETCVLVMLVAGFLAARRGLALAGTRNVTQNPADPAASPERARGHRGAGKLAMGAAVLGLLSAAVVLFDMYQRAGLV